MARRRVGVVPHTHWDREWYSPFQTFRLRLVDLLDDLLVQLETDPSYAHFLLDGQMAVVDDYLAVRPEAEPVLRRLAATGRLSMGPWYIQMDEFLVSGETIVRDLQLGIERATAFGGAMPVGYLPDLFGHIGQMPQLLRQAGIGHAVMWRGVPAAIDRTAFWWQAPDGSQVRAEYLWDGYFNGSAIPDDAKALVRRIEALEHEWGDALVGDLLFMNGMDHQLPQPWLGRVVAEANDIQDQYELVVTGLADHLAAATTEGLPTWRGELRSAARANLLPGVASNRVDVKQAAARAERVLERVAEPLCALFLPAAAWPRSLLELAWREMIRNSAHDSICACSSEEVVDAVLHRYAEARQIAEGLAARAVKALAQSMPEAGVVVVNSSPRRRSAVIELRLPGEDPPQGDNVQLLSDRRPGLGHLAVTAGELPAILGGMRSQQIDHDTFINAVDVEEGADGLHIDLHADSRLREVLNLEAIKAGILERVAGRADLPVHLRLRRQPVQRLLTRVTDVPGYGWAPWAPAPLTVSPVTAEGQTLANGLVTVEVDPRDGTFSIDGHRGLDRLVDDGDHGDTYNYSPPEHDRVVDAPDDVEITVEEAGPLRGQLRVQRRFTWPAAIDNKARARVGQRAAEIETVLELHAGERLVRVTTSFENPSRDHRLRAWFPLPQRAATSRAECAFSVVERGLEAEGGLTERAIATFPSRRFVSAGGLTVVHEGLCEYELVDGGAALALTLLRATGMLSRVEMANRPLPAGPPLPTRHAQMLGPVTVRYGVHVGDADPYALVDDAFLPLIVSTTPGGGTRTATGTELDVEGAEVSAVRREAQSLEVRVFNPGPEATTARFGGRSGWRVDLRGRPLAPFEGSVELGGFEIATVRFPG